MFKIRTTTTPNDYSTRREQARAMRPAVDDIVTLVGQPNKKYRVTASGLRYCRLESLDNPAEKGIMKHTDVLKESL